MKFWTFILKPKCLWCVTITILSEGAVHARLSSLFSFRINGINLCCTTICNGRIQVKKVVHSYHYIMKLNKTCHKCHDRKNLYICGQVSVFELLLLWQCEISRRWWTVNISLAGLCNLHTQYTHMHAHTQPPVWKVGYVSSIITLFHNETYLTLVPSWVQKLWVCIFKSFHSHCIEYLNF